ncbi:MAG: ubiquinol-cytochrome C chaperone family protein, partial [Pseudobdellovibrionaceae bacterium]
MKNEALALYTAAVTAARREVFYENLSVPDTLDGRFDMICLHVSLLVDAITPPETEKPNALGQAVFDVMFKDMDLNIREMGIGDLGVPRHIKKMMRALKGRFMAYR